MRLSSKSKTAKELKVKSYNKQTNVSHMHKITMKGINFVILEAPLFTEQFSSCVVISSGRNPSSSLEWNGQQGAFQIGLQLVGRKLDYE